MSFWLNSIRNIQMNILNSKVDKNVNFFLKNILKFKLNKASSTFYNPFSNASAYDRQLSKPVGMLSLDERRMLHHYAESASGAGSIIDAGAFLGASAFSIALGLAKNKQVKRKQVIFSYDQFTPDKVSKDYITKYFPNFDAVSFKSIFDEQLGDHAQYIVVKEGNFLDMKWTGHEIELLFIDICKSAELNGHLISQFFPSLIPGKSIVIHQDYHHPYLYWIHITMQVLAEYFEVIHEQVCSSMVWRIRNHPPHEVLQRCIDYSFSAEEQVQLIMAAYHKLAPLNRGGVALAIVVLEHQLNGRQSAIKKLKWAMSIPEHRELHLWERYLKQLSEWLDYPLIDSEKLTLKPVILDSKKWTISNAHGNTATLLKDLIDSKCFFKIDGLISVSEKAWHTSLSYMPIKIYSNQQYLLKFLAKSNLNSQVSVGISRSYGDWSNLGFYTTINLTPTFDDFEFTFRLNDGDDQARLHFDIGFAKDSLVIGDLQLFAIVDKV
jgi:hypothetical protein